MIPPTARLTALPSRIVGTNITPINKSPSDPIEIPIIGIGEKSSAGEEGESAGGVSGSSCRVKNL